MTVMQETKALVYDKIDTKAARSIKESTLLTGWALRIALLIRFDRLKTTQQAQQLRDPAH